jgi:hypothetical protein
MALTTMQILSGLSRRTHLSPSECARTRAGFDKLIAEQAALDHAFDAVLAPNAPPD